MRKLIYLFIALIFSSGLLIASPVSQGIAQKVASNFYGQVFKTPVTSVSLAYTETDATGLAVYYAFNINDKGGFVLVSAEDAGRPIIGYSNKGAYTIPKSGNNIDFWMQKRKKEIIAIRSHNLTASSGIAEEWNAYINNISPKNHKSFHKTLGTVFPSDSLYLVQSTWDQPYPYNLDCPGGSVTGCVATCMSQIMRYWSYPPHGTGSSTYYSTTYGVLSANYNHPYRWSLMPLNSPTGADTDMARLLSDAGVSVDMAYSTSESGAEVITADDASACAQIAYVKYFNYSPKLIDGLKIFADSLAWLDTLENELNHNRPIEYVGVDPAAGGHTWVCDGYDSLAYFHMNWGWSALDDGWYTLNDLNPGGMTGYFFSTDFEALIGIAPPEIEASFTSGQTMSCSALTVNYTDQSFGVGTPKTWNWSFPGGSPSTSTQQNPTVVYSAPGAYTVTEIVADSTGATDTLVKINYVTIEPTPGMTPPMIEGFQSDTFPPSGWVINNPLGHETTWALYSGAGGFGKSAQCMYYNNCTGGITGNYDQIYSPEVNFTNVTNPMLYFDVAYEPYGYMSGVDYTDTLAIYYSTDCGSTWKNIYMKGGQTLATTGEDSAETGTDTNGQGCFVPIASAWRTDTVRIPAIAGMPGVMFSFENRSGNGTSMYIDNINLPLAPPPLSTINISNPARINIYPNPNNGSFTIQSSAVSGQSSVVIYNVLGQNIYNATLDAGKTQINFTQTPGVYFYRILSLDGKALSEGKLVVK